MIFDDPLLDARKEALRSRGVPDKFIAPIAEMRSPRTGPTYRSPPITGLFVALAAGLFLVFMGVINEGWMAKAVYAPQVHGSDLFVPGPFFDAILVFGAISLFMAPLAIWLWIAVTLNIRWAEKDDHEQKGLVTAFWLTHTVTKTRNPISPDMRLDCFADAPTVDAFLNEVARGAAIPFGSGYTPISRQRAAGVYIVLLVWIAILFGFFEGAANGFVNIHGGELEYKSLWSHFTLPLSQVEKVQVRCSSSSKSHAIYLNYVLTFHGHRINLFDSHDPLTGKYWLDNFDALARIDRAFAAAHVPMEKLGAYDQLRRRDQQCLVQYRLTDEQGDPRERQLVLANP